VRHDHISAPAHAGLTRTVSYSFSLAQVHAKARCVYCSGTGYLPCAQCGTRGKLISREGSKSFCPTCSGTGKVMCTSCLCTGMAMATEHDPRIDPFV
jgi:hypothetical protein